MTMTCTEARARLTAAEAALHDLRLGNKAVMVQRGEKRVEFRPANVSALASYVAELQRAVDRCDGKCGGRRVLRYFPVGE